MPISDLEVEQAEQREEAAAEARAVAILNGTAAITEELAALRAELNPLRTSAMTCGPRRAAA